MNGRGGLSTASNDYHGMKREKERDGVCASAELIQFLYGLAPSSAKTRITLLTYQFPICIS